MKTRRLFSLLFAILFVFSACGAFAEGLQPLDMDSTAIAPAPKDECYLSDNEYLDESIHVTIEEGDWNDVHYFVARVQIAHPSQLRTTPGYQIYNPAGDFSSGYANEPLGRDMAQAANAVIAINGDYYTKQATCQRGLLYENGSLPYLPAAGKTGSQHRPRAGRAGGQPGRGFYSASEIHQG